MRRGWKCTLAIFHVVVVITSAFADPSRSSIQSTAPAGQQENQPAPDAGRPRAETKRYSVTVTVLTGESSAESPVKGAGVTIFVGDHKETIKTGSDGQVLFTFDAAVKTATIRVVADHYVAAQKQVTLGDGENDYRITLKKSD